MIVSIMSSIPTFKTVTFREGLNVLLADTSPGATEKQTRNSAGKTSLIEIIHFLMGSDCDKDSLFRTDALIEHSFQGTFLIDGEKFVVSRTGSDPSKIFLVEGGDRRDELSKRTDKATGRLNVSNTNWRVFLGHAHFGMPADIRGTIYEEAYTPNFRPLFSYFARRRNSGGFLSPERQAERQQRVDWQVNLSYLLGLDWQIPLEFNKVRIRENTLDELKKAARGGAFGNVLGTVAQLRPQVTIAEAQAEKLRAQLDNFEVLESYRELARRAAAARTEMQAIGRDAVSAHESLAHLEQALEAERPPAKADLERLYSAAGIELPGLALRRFEEVAEFYDSVIANRRTHLQQEIADLRQGIAEGERRQAELDAERSGILKTLEGRGALDDFLELQRTLARCEATAATLRERFKAAELLEGETTQLVIDRVNLKRRLQEDHQGRKQALDEAILLIASAIADLYQDRSGRFVVEATDNGPEFKISIEGDRGGGISNMEIFCFDLALFNVTTKRFGGPGFLIHDSHLFDGVDERQIAGALELGAKTTSEKALQYIVTMNSDIFDRVPLPDDIDRSSVVLSTRLSDETETGGLFGFRFG
jgi:uncharacterized protein YydD (DUF2326 family)